MRRAALLVTCVALSAPGCSPEYPNPFEDDGQARMVPPPAGSALIFASDAWATTPGRGREIMAIAADGSGLTRLTFCDDGQRPCDSSEAAFASDHIRAAMLRSLDVNADGVAALVDLPPLGQPDVEVFRQVRLGVPLDRHRALAGSPQQRRERKRAQQHADERRLHRNAAALGVLGGSGHEGMDCSVNAHRCALRRNR